MGVLTNGQSTTHLLRTMRARLLGELDRFRLVLAKDAYGVTMKLGKTKNGQIEPLDNEALFLHCANGMASVDEGHYYETVEPLLIIHGIVLFECTWIQTWFDQGK